MKGFPTSVAHQQLARVCEALGIDTNLVSVSRLEIDANTGVTVTIAVCGTDGRKIRHGDDLLKAEIHIPISYDELSEEDIASDPIAQLRRR